MRYMIDTNILISASLFPDSVPARAFIKAVSPPHSAVVCDYSMEEMRRVYNRKFPHKIMEYERFVSMLAVAIEIVVTPTDKDQTFFPEETRIRDLKDRPIYRAAFASHVDGLITGDKDFLESGILMPKMITATTFLEMV